MHFFWHLQPFFRTRRIRSGSMPFLSYAFNPCLVGMLDKKDKVVAERLALLNRFAGGCGRGSSSRKSSWRQFFFRTGQASPSISCRSSWRQFRPCDLRPCDLRPCDLRPWDLERDLEPGTGSSSASQRSNLHHLARWTPC